jgi:hypothetical protein
MRRITATVDTIDRLITVTRPAHMPIMAGRVTIDRMATGDIITANARANARASCLAGPEKFSLQDRS